ncbi:Tad domain-containing protein [Streptomyces sp. CA-250714]|uniref:Tad domain-containing protein n=1 Tax=Streptomyces sp. CA-250714 TaxID=3240060 RepID=UPI003D8C72BC
MHHETSRYLKVLRSRMGDRGGLELLYAGMALVGFLIIGLVVDGGGALDAKSHADYVAQEAARAGAQEIDASQAIPGDAIVVDPEAARQAATSYLDAQGVSGSVRVGDDGQTLTVHVTETYDAVFNLTDRRGIDPCRR